MLLLEQLFQFRLQREGSKSFTPLQKNTHPWFVNLNQEMCLLAQSVGRLYATFTHEVRWSRLWMPNSVDCTHFVRRKCPTSLQVQFMRCDKKNQQSCLKRWRRMFYVFGMRTLVLVIQKTTTLCYINVWYSIIKCMEPQRGVPLWSMGDIHTRLLSS